jgi:hypothetical protein
MLLSTKKSWQGAYILCPLPLYQLWKASSSISSRHMAQSSYHSLNYSAELLEFSYNIASLISFPLYRKLLKPIIMLQQEQRSLNMIPVPNQPLAFLSSVCPTAWLAPTTTAGLLPAPTARLKGYGGRF